MIYALQRLRMNGSIPRSEAPNPGARSAKVHVEEGISILRWQSLARRQQASVHLLGRTTRWPKHTKRLARV